MEISTDFIIATLVLWCILLLGGLALRLKNKRHHHDD